jgi:hypothetical protein
VLRGACSFVRGRVEPQVTYRRSTGRCERRSGGGTARRCSPPLRRSAPLHSTCGYDRDASGAARQAGAMWGGAARRNRSRDLAVMGLAAPGGARSATSPSRSGLQERSAPPPLPVLPKESRAVADACARALFTGNLLGRQARRNHEFVVQLGEYCSLAFQGCIACTTALRSW